MSTMTKMVKVAVANEGERSMSVEEIQKWEVKNHTYSAGSVFVKTEDGVYSMEIKDFEEIFKR